MNNWQRKGQWNKITLNCQLKIGQFLQWEKRITWNELLLDSLRYAYFMIQKILWFTHWKIVFLEKKMDCSVHGHWIRLPDWSSKINSKDAQGKGYCFLNLVIYVHFSGDWYMSSRIHSSEVSWPRQCLIFYNYTDLCT